MDEMTVRSIVDLAAPTRFTVAGLEYSSDALYMLKPPLAPLVEVSTLQGFVDGITNGIENFAEEGVVALVVNPTTVDLVRKVADTYGQRQVLLRASLPKGVETFKFGSWHDPENFTISVQANFQRSAIEAADGAVIGDTDYVLRIASHISAEMVTLSQDDGIAQNITVKQGIALKAQEQMKSRVMLSPYRTFPEINQPLSTFVFRVRHQGGEVIHLALFEADGGRWRIGAAAEVATWLTGKIPETIKVIR
jgi:hypothetical protein